MPLIEVGEIRKIKDWAVTGSDNSLFHKILKQIRLFGLQGNGRTLISWNMILGLCRNSKAFARK